MPGCWRMAIFVGGCSRADDEPAERIVILTSLRFGVGWRNWMLR